MDKNKDGLITKKEYRKGIKAANKANKNPDETITNKKLNELFESLDSNKDGKLNISEFSASGTTRGNFFSLRFKLPF